MDNLRKIKLDANSRMEANGTNEIQDVDNSRGKASGILKQIYDLSRGLKLSVMSKASGGLVSVPSSFPLSLG